MLCCGSVLIFLFQAQNKLGPNESQTGRTDKATLVLTAEDRIGWGEEESLQKSHSPERLCVGARGGGPRLPGVRTALLHQAPQCFQRSQHLGPSESQPHQQRMSLEGRLEVVGAKLGCLHELPAEVGGGTWGRGVEA